MSHIKKAACECGIENQQRRSPDSLLQLTVLSFWMEGCECVSF